MSVATRYAEALLMLAEENDKLNEIVNEFHSLMDMLNKNEKIFKMLEHPVVSQSEKKEMFDHLTQNMQTEIKNFLHVIINKKRENLLSHIYREFNRLALAHQNRVLCYVTTSHPLEQSEKEELKQSLAKISASQVELEDKVDQGIIGGIVVRIGDTVYDYSIKRQLNRLEEQLKKTTITS